MLTDGAWMDLEPLLEACRPKGKTPPQDLRRTISAILWRHQNGAKWRAIPADLGPWSRAAQMFIRWAHLGVWERLLLLAQARGVQLGMTFLGATSTERDEREALGRSRGGYGTKACVIADGLGRAVAFILAPGQAHERPQAVPLLERLPGVPQWVVADRGHASTPSASTSGAWARVRRSRPSRTKPRWPARSGSMSIATTWSGSGRGSRSGGRSRPATRRPPPASWASSASLPLSIGSSPNRP